MPKHDLKELNDRTVKRLELPAGKKQEEHFWRLYKSRSLILTLNASCKSWSVLFYAKGGKPRRKKLGTFPAMNVTKAQKAAMSFDDKEALATAEAGTFKKVSEQFLKRHVQEKGLRTEREITRILDKYLLPKWGPKPFAEIDTEAITDLMDDIVDNYTKSQADAVRSVVSKLMRWQEDRKGGNYRRPHIPARRQPPVKRQRWLNNDEVKAVWESAEDVPIFGALIRLLLLTGQRVGKVVNMRWADINLETGEWRIPREPREKGTPKAITLPETALEIIKQQDRVLGSPYVFPGRGKKQRFDAFSQRKAELDKMSGVTDWHIHDLRRTCRKLMTRARVQRDVAEAALGHVIKGVEGVYVDSDEYRPEIDEALSRVAGEINRLLEPSAEVVNLRG
jgi:integrase